MSETLRDLKRDASRKAYGLIIATNANLPDKSRHTDAVGEMVDAIVAVAVQETLRALRPLIPEIGVGGGRGWHMFVDAVEAAILPVAPPENEAP
jgi:hypothetical protein